MRKTQSEIICNEIGSKFFSKDFVYENLKYFNEKITKLNCAMVYLNLASFILLCKSRKGLPKRDKNQKILGWKKLSMVKLLNK